MLPDSWNGTVLEDGENWSNNTAKFLRWFRDFGYSGDVAAIQETEVIKNYGTVSYDPHFIS
jgi:hypothetical protein